MDYEKALSEIKSYNIIIDNHDEGINIDGEFSRFCAETSYDHADRLICKGFADQIKEMGYVPQKLRIDFSILGDPIPCMHGAQKVYFSAVVTYDVNLDRFMKWKDGHPIFEDYSGVITTGLNAIRNNYEDSENMG